MNKFEEVVSNISGNHVYIQTHNFPDPDAIASAYGLQMLLRTKNIDSTICYKGQIDKGNTIKMVNSLNISIANLEELEDLHDNDEVILIDAQKGNANIIDMTGNEIICIDHHPTYEKIEYVYSDIRPEVGACASIIASYYYDNNIIPDGNVATALMYGIKIDTDNMTRGVSELDLEMFYKLYRLSDNNLLNSLDLSKIQFTDLQAYASAINTMKIYDNISFANTGLDCPEALIATISDFVLALDEVNLSVVYSIKRDGIKLSVRSDFRKYNAGNITNVALSGIGNGGGHETMAGGFVPFDNGPKELLIAKIQERFVDTINDMYGKQLSNA